MLEQISMHFPSDVKVWKPGGGLFIWAELPPEHNAYELLQQALDKGVAFIPARGFYAGNDVDNTMRLNFLSATQEQVAQGIEILGGLMR